ncbi:MAG TPA: HAMP domain-containing sensor histidine kinase, partial [Holophagaceae bacterium]
QMDSLRLMAITYQPDPASRAGAIEGHVPKLPSLQERKWAIETLYPHVAVVPSPLAEDDPPLLDKAAYLTLRPEPLRAIEKARRTDIIRAASEGSFLAFVVLLGFGLIYRQLAEELDLKLRQHNFIAAVTHELKTPISSLQVWTDTVFSRALSEEQRLRIRDLMEKDLGRLTELVGNLLEVARAEAGSLDLHPTALDLGPWLRGVCEAMDQRLGAGALGLRLELAVNVWAYADPKALGSVVENLLSNAFKYAAVPRTTTVTLDADGDQAVLVVSDLGHGIGSKDLPRLFQRFHRAGDEMTRAVPGTGLGLFLTREIVLRHGGTIQAASRGPGLGSTFTVRLPRIPPVREDSSGNE